MRGLSYQVGAGILPGLGAKLCGSKLIQNLSEDGGVVVGWRCVVSCFQVDLKRLTAKGKEKGSKLSNIKWSSTEELSGDTREMHKESLP